MRKKPTSTSRRRLCLDWLEKRCLLSGGFEVVAVRPAPEVVQAPALILGLNINQAQRPDLGLGGLAVSTEPGYAGTLTVSLTPQNAAHAIALAPVMNLISGAPHTYAEPARYQVLRPFEADSTASAITGAAVGGLAVSREVVTSGEAAGSGPSISSGLTIVVETTASSDAVASPGDPTVEVSPDQPPLEQVAVQGPGLSPGAFGHIDIPPGMPMPGYPMLPLLMGGDMGKVLHLEIERDLSTRPNPDDTTIDTTDATAQPAAEPANVTVTPPANSAPALVQGGSSMGPIAPYVVSAPGRTTALSGLENGSDDASSRTLLNPDLAVNQPIEVARAVVSDSSSDSPLTPEAIVAVRTNLGESHSSADVGPPVVATQESKLLIPQAAGLIANALPFDEGALEQALDRFFDKLEDLAVEQIVEPGSTRAIPLFIALLGTLTAAEVVRRRLRSRNATSQSTERSHALGSEELLGFPELPGSWSTNLT